MCIYALQIPVVNHIMRESLKRKAKDVEMVLDLHQVAEKFLSLIPCLASNEDVQLGDVDWAKELVDVPASSRVWVLTGFLLRGLKNFWRVALVISTMLHPINIDDTDDKYLHLGKQRDLFKTGEFYSQSRPRECLGHKTIDQWKRCYEFLAAQGRTPC